MMRVKELKELNRYFLYKKNDLQKTISANHLIIMCFFTTTY